MRNYNSLASGLILVSGFDISLLYLTTLISCF